MLFSKTKLLIEYFKVAKIVLIGNFNYAVEILRKNDCVMLEYLTFSKIKVSQMYIFSLNKRYIINHSNDK